MGSIVFVPGILGSELFLGAEMVWPPTVKEVTFGYGRIDKLSDDAVTFGGPVAKVCVRAVYQPLLDDLAVIASGTVGAPKRRFHAMGYDWRRDVRAAAASIAERIDALPVKDQDELILVGHSMGCLVLRVILEGPDFQTRPWFAKIKTFVAMAGPHRGAPVALVRALGLEGSVGLSGPDIKRLSGDKRFPSVYQLLPAPGLVALWSGLDGEIAPEDFYSPAVALRLGLSKTNLMAARALHKLLSRNAAPAHVRYIQLAGTGHSTPLRVDSAGDIFIARGGIDAGDGTVPLWSALDPRLPGHAAPGVHDSVFTSSQLRVLLYRAMEAVPPTVSGLETFDADGNPVIAIDVQVAAMTHPVGQPLEIVLAPQADVARMDGRLIIERHDDGAAGARIRVFESEIRVEAANISSLRLETPPLNEKGLHEAWFEDQAGRRSGASAAFVVAQDHG